MDALRAPWRRRQALDRLRRAEELVRQPTLRDFAADARALLASEPRAGETLADRERLLDFAAPCRGLEVAWQEECARRRHAENELEDALTGTVDRGDVAPSSLLRADELSPWAALAAERPARDAREREVARVIATVDEAGRQAERAAEQALWTRDGEMGRKRPGPRVHDWLVDSGPG
jgi:hypothetical protein